MLLVCLSSVAFAAGSQNDLCKQQDLGGCETLFICPNGVSLIVKYEQGPGNCYDKVISKYIIDSKEQKVTEVSNKK